MHTVDILDDRAVAQILGCKRKTIQEKARRGEIPGIKIGRSWRFPAGSLLQFLNDLALSNKPKKRPHVPVALVIAAPKRRRKKLLDLSAIQAATPGLHPGGMRT